MAQRVAVPPLTDDEIRNLRAMREECCCNREPDAEGRYWYNAGCRAHGVKSLVMQRIDRAAREERSALC